MSRFLAAFNLLTFAAKRSIFSSRRIVTANPTLFSARCLSSSSNNNFSIYESLVEIVGESNVSQSKAIRMQYAKDEGHFSAKPSDIVVFPVTTAEVSQVCKLCYDNNIAMTAFGTGTGLEGGVNALKGGVTIALTNMKEVIKVSIEDFDCIVEAGVTWRDLNAHLNGTGLFFPVDPGASASLGGMASTNASGTNAVRYGTMKDNVLNLEVVLPDGRICNTNGILTRSIKSSAGYNLTGLFVGSEGTLGLITKVTLRLYPIPENSCICVCHFDDNESAIETVISMLQNNILLSRVEFVDDLSISAANKFSRLHRKLAEKPSLFLEIAGLEAETLINLVQEIVIENGGKEFEFSSRTEEKTTLMKARHELYYSCQKTRPGHKSIITDVCVPISKLTDIILKMRSYIDEHNLNGFSFGHVGDGNFHSVITYDENDEAETAKVYRIAHQIGMDAIALGGTCTGEHGVGRGKKKLLKMQFDPNTLDLMRAVKKTIDPKNLLNPGKVLPD